MGHCTAFGVWVVVHHFCLVTWSIVQVKAAKCEIQQGQICYVTSWEFDKKRVTKPKFVAQSRPALWLFATSFFNPQQKYFCTTSWSRRVKNAKNRPKTCSETMLRDKLRVFVSSTLPPAFSYVRDPCWSPDVNTCCSLKTTLNSNNSKPSLLANGWVIMTIQRIISNTILWHSIKFLSYRTLLRTFPPRISHVQIFLKLCLQVENDNIRLKT